MIAAKVRRLNLHQWKERRAEIFVEQLVITAAGNGFLLDWSGKNLAGFFLPVGFSAFWTGSPLPSKRANIAKKPFG